MAATFDRCLPVIQPVALALLDLLPVFPEDARVLGSETWQPQPVNWLGCYARTATIARTRSWLALLPATIVGGFVAEVKTGGMLASVIDRRVAGVVLSPEAELLATAAASWRQS